MYARPVKTSVAVGELPRLTLPKIYDGERWLCTSFKTGQKQMLVTQSFKQSHGGAYSHEIEPHLKHPNK